MVLIYKLAAPMLSSYAGMRFLTHAFLLLEGKTLSTAMF